MNLILLDTNVVLDVLLGREPWYSESARIWDANREGKISAWIAASSLPTIFYIVTKQAGLEKAHLAVVNCLQSLNIVTVDRSTLELAQGYAGTDFEDNLEMASAIQASLDAIATRDAKGFPGSSITILPPAELIARLNSIEQGQAATS